MLNLLWKGSFIFMLSNFYYIFPLKLAWMIAISCLQLLKLVLDDFLHNICVPIWIKQLFLFEPIQSKHRNSTKHCWYQDPLHQFEWKLDHPLRSIRNWWVENITIKDNFFLVERIGQLCYPSILKFPLLLHADL